ncbi:MULTISPECIES: amino acid adenylation domain-containing protein [unclassified Streptomyces]|uniref:non-ribosomal peptide synthetase n=1 Tax=unclassified Streptomyces TaxID=2593676 RepID=UPI00278BE0B4|nr:MULTISPECIES: amino acid adenylation domain-containing protein [unclassified Streptomyces]
MSGTGTAIVPALLDELARNGIRLQTADDGRLEVRAPKGRLTADLRERIGLHKPELLRWLASLSAPRPATGPLPQVVPDPAGRYEPFPPSDLQASFLIGSREGFEYYVRPHQYFEYEQEDLDPELLERAMNAELHYQRDNIVVVREDMRLQTVRSPGPATLPVLDVRHLSAPEAESAVERVRTRMAGTQPVIEHWPWVDLRLSRLPGGRSRLHLNNNNIFCDAPALLRFVSTVLRRYREPDWSPPPLEIGFRECVLTLAELEESPLGQASRAYWTERIPDWPEAPPVPLTGADPRTRSDLRRRELLFSAEVWSALKRRAADRHLTTTNVLSAVQAEVLSYWSGSRHFLLNNMITHRLPLHPQLPDVMGNFASLYPLEVDWRPHEPFEARARRLQDQVLADAEHGHFSGVKVLQELNHARRTPGRAVCPFAIGSALFVGPQDLPVASRLETPQTLVDCEFWDLTDGRLWVVWDVIETMFPDGLVDAMEQGYRTVVERLAADDDAWSTEAFDLLPERQRTRRAELNRPSAPVPSGLLHHPLRRRSVDRPRRPAVVAADGALNYGELGEHCERIAALLRAHAAPGGGTVAVVLPKSRLQVAAVLGVLSAGRAYVPLDPEWPRERLRAVLADAAPTAVLADPSAVARLAALTDAPVLDVTAPAPDAPPAPAPEPAPTDLAYVIYTSGSTGRPKGAMLDHRGPLNTVAEINRRFGVTERDVLFGVSSLCFDLSVYDVFGAVHAGASLVLPKPGDPDPGGWLEAVREHGVTVWNSVPALMQLLVEEAEATGVTCPSLRTVLLSGDWIPVDLPDRIRAIAPNAAVIGLGGATEASIWSICHPIGEVDPAWASIPYGKPLANQSWHVLDDRGRLSPAWVPGELYIGGVGLALGYLGDEERTRAAFVHHPHTGERLYRTGDLGRCLPDGTIEFLGRADQQVKIQGFRVEPGEVEHALTELPSVGRAAVVAHGTDAGKQLAAYVTAAEEAVPPTGEELSVQLAERLPSYLVPARITVLDRLPLTRNGKLDRAALQARGADEAQAARPYAAPRTDLEAVLARMWATVLGQDRVGVHDDFFDLGGQSFTALRLIGQIARRLDRRVPLGTLLERRTVARLAEWLTAGDEAWDPLVTLREGPGNPWFFVHPAGGNVLCYRELADRLGGPFHAFQAPAEPAATMDGLLEPYVEALRAARPHGPYRLGGWSSGAVIASALAERLESLGERVERLVVIDSPAPLDARTLDPADLPAWFLEDLNIGFDPLTADVGALKALVAATASDRAPDPAETGVLLHRAAGADCTLAPSELAAAYQVFRAVVPACAGYSAGPVDADVTVVRAAHGTVGEFADHPCADAPDWGWAALAPGRTGAVTLPGSHHTLLTGELVGAVSDAITRCTEEDVPR